MRSIISQLKEKIQFKKNNFHPFIKGIYYAAFTITSLAFFLGAFYFRTGISPWLQVLIYLGIGSLCFFVFQFLGAWLSIIFKKIPAIFYSISLALLAGLYLAAQMRFNWPDAIYSQSILLGISILSLIYGGLFCLVDKRPGKLFYGALIVIGLLLSYWTLEPLINSGEDPHMLNLDNFSIDNLPTIQEDNPSQKGNYSFEYFTYGSGNDQRRPEYNEQVKLTTQPVDASLLLPEWKGRKKKWREKYWGFGIENAPINGRVWMPLKGNKLPLIMIVHGNHSMEHHSDPGYQYLGELLASRGFITVSVDENFINGTWSGDFRGKEMPARAWLLLKHLKQWEQWTNNPSSELFEKADLNNVILIGHSRGGEAVSIAAAYNKLNHFPDNAQVKFDFHFGIQGLIAIAPTDARYFRRIELEDVSYLSIQGTYDADEASFFGLRQYQRVSFSDRTNHMKSGILIHKANHGQFNSIWGRRDFGEPYGWFLNTGALLSGEDQRQVAKVFISAFAERVFNQKPYDSIFSQPYLAQDWLPKTFYLSNYQNANSEFIIDYEDGIDLANKTNAFIKSDGIQIWREEELKMRDGGVQGTNAVILGWDDTNEGSQPSYSIDFKDSILIQKESDFIFSVGRYDSEQIDLNGQEPIDIKIDIETSSGHYELFMSDTKNLAPLLKIKYMKFPVMNTSFGSDWEVNMETVALPFRSSANKKTYLKKLRFSFINSSKGMIALDNIGFRHSIRSSER